MIFKTILNAFINKINYTIQAQAKEYDKNPTEGILAGIPISLKDHYTVAVSCFYI